MHINGVGGTSFFEQKGLIVTKITAVILAEEAYPKIEMEASDTDFRADFKSDQISFATSTSFDVKDGIRIEVSRNYNPTHGIVRYLDGTPVDAIITEITITADAATNTFGAVLTVVPPEVGPPAPLPEPEP